MGNVSTFCDKKEVIGAAEVLSCHLAYINHMVHGESWDVPNDLAQWFRLLAGVKGAKRSLLSI